MTFHPGFSSKTVSRWQSMIKKKKKDNRFCKSVCFKWVTGRLNWRFFLVFSHELSDEFLAKTRQKKLIKNMIMNILFLTKSGSSHSDNIERWTGQNVLTQDKKYIKKKTHNGLWTIWWTAVMVFFDSCSNQNQIQEYFNQCRNFSL